jgi:two-component system, chemotaxis family, chemotaxis protein CheY
MDLKNHRFLVIDDHSLILRMVAATLRENGATEIDEASDGAAAIEKIRKAAQDSNPYHVVMLDWALPRINGYEILLTCRADPRCNNMAVIMLTAESEETNIVKALEAGATAYITKPFKPDQFLKKLEDVLNWRARRLAAAS